MPTIAAILLAAGRSSRMDTPKALLPWDATNSLILHQTTSIVSAGFDPVVVVAGHDYAPITNELSNSNVTVVINHEYDKGRSSSIVKGLNALNHNIDGILIISVDQPSTQEILTILLNEWIQTSALIATPSFNGESGHPILFHSSLIADLLSITEEKQGLREVVAKHRHSRIFVPINDPLVLININTPDDYQSALKMYTSKNL